VDAADDVVISLSRDEALVLFEWLHRSEDQGQVAGVEHDAERVALRNLSGPLERVLAEPFDPNYQQLVADVRTRLASKGQQGPSTR
jgi:hypothetical protein